MRSLRHAIAVALMLVLAAAPGFAADKEHRVAIHVDQNDPAVMNLALNNATNIMEEYKSRGETVQIEVVAYGPGLHMLRADTSPVQDRLKQIVEMSFPSSIKFSACENTRQRMEKQEGKAVSVVSQAQPVPSGVVRLIELQEQGWSYLKP